MAKYKLTVKCGNICELTLTGGVPDIIEDEFDKYISSLLNKAPQNSEDSIFALCAKVARVSAKDITSDEITPEIPNNEEAQTEAAGAEGEGETADTTESEEVFAESKAEAKTVPAEEADCARETDFTGEAPCGEADLPENTHKTGTLTFKDFIENKNINTPLDEFVAGACYLDEVENIKLFSLKQLNSKLYPAFGRLANSDIINLAKERVLIETTKDEAGTRYSINQNAWNYHNYDLVRR